MKILIAEDQPTAALPAATLEKMGHEPSLRPTARGLADVPSGEAPLLISDWMMPHLDGPDLCRRSGPRGEPLHLHHPAHLRDRREDRLKGLPPGRRLSDQTTRPR